ncbi:uncharacterized protein [Macrobrachium rosenbergii]|uniref:uncharacterized protein isoform X1 n=1 Tax=Macrobrachium rosenbergii TaxID=79674 RepID=UPI0034D5A131
MDKRRVARIPSIFDSDDEEDDTSQNTGFSQEDNSDGEAPCKSPVAGQSCVEESTSRAAREENEEMSDAEDEDKSENDSKHDESKTSIKDNGGDDEQDALDSDEEQNSKNFEEVTDRGSTHSYNVDDEENLEEEESEIVKDNDSSAVNEVEEEKDPLDEDEDMDYRGDSNGVNDSNDNSDEFGEVEDNENLVDEEFLSDEEINEKDEEDEEDFEEELVSAEGNEVDKHDQEEGDDEMEDFDDLEDLNDAEDNTEEIEEGEETENEMEDDEGIGARVDENDVGVIRDDVTDEESLIDEEEEAAMVENEANDSLETSTSDKDVEEAEEVCSNGELVEEAGSNDELVEEVGSTEELVEVGSNGEGMDEKHSSTREIADNRKVGDEADTNSVDNDKEEEFDNKDDSSVYEDGSDGYVIDLNGSEEESGPECTKLEDREDIIDSSTSCSSVVSEGKSKCVKTKEVSQANLEPELTNENDDMENSPKPPETVEVSSETAVDQTATKKNILKDKVPETTVRRKIPLIRVPVRIEDIYTDSEDDSKKTPKDAKTNEIKDDTDQDDQKNIVSVSSQSESVDSESLSPDSAAQACSSKGERPRIWVSSSLFDRKNASKSVDKTPTDVEPHATKSVRPHIRPQKSFNKEKCLLALKQGWRREMVHRATFDVNTPKRVRADIYYYTPEGKKLRSRVEIEDYLLRKGITDLTMDNFTFAKESVGGTEEQEQIRHAVKGTLGSTPRQKVDTANQNTASPTLPAGENQKRGRPRKIAKEESPAKKIKTASTFKVPMIEKNENKSTTFRKATVKGIEKSPYSNVVKVSSGPARPLTAIQTSPSWKSSSTPKGSQSSKTEASTSTTVPRSHFVNKNHVVFTTKLCNSIGLPIRILTPMLSERTRQQLFHCTGQCQLGAGTVPSLQCIKCLCLFHGQCTLMPAATVELIQSGGAKFLCPNCYKENKENADNLKYTPPTPHELLVQDPTSSESETGDEMNESPSNLPSGYVRVNFKRKFSLPTPPSSPVHEVNGNLEDLGNKDEGKQTGVISSSFPSHSSTTSTLSYGQHQAASNPVLNPNIPNSQNPVLGVGPGGQIVQIPAPSVGGPRLIFVRPQQTNSNVQHMPQVGPRAVYIPSIGGQVPLMLSGAGSSYSTSATHYVNGSNPPTSSQLYVSPGVDYSHPISSTISPLAKQEKQKTPPRSHPKVIASQKKNFFQELSMSYQLLLRVFKYLTAKDLLVTSCVCVMWRDLSYSSALWNTLRLRNICVRNWSLLAMFLERRNTRNIDLRKMVFRINSSAADQEECSKADSSFDSPTSVRNPYSSKNIRHSEESYTTEDKDDLEDEDAPHDNQPMDLSSYSSKRVVSPVKEASVSPEKTFSENAEGEIVSSCAKQDSVVPIKGDSERPSVDAAGASLKNTELHTKEGSAKAGESNVENLSVSCTKEGSLPATGLTTTIDSDVTKRKDVKETDKDNSKNQSTVDNKGDNPSGNSKLRSEENVINISSCSEEEPMEIDEGIPIDNTEVTNKVSRNVKEVQEKGSGKQQVRVDKLPYKSTPIASDCISERIRQKREGKIIVAAVTEDDNIATKKMEMDTWRHICEALGTVRCLRSVVLPPCMPEVLHLMLSNCKNITSVTAADIISSSDVEFDPAYFMEAPRLKEIRIGSAQGLSFTTNFNFIKLQELKVLVVKGYVGSCWPYLGTNLTSLHLGPCHNFTHQTWMNIGSMKNLRALWLEDGGSSTDNHMVEAINQLTQLRRLCLFNFVVGVKLGIALKKLTKLERLFVLQNSSGEENMGVKNHNMLAVTEHLRYVDELVWAVSSQDVKVINGVDHMHISSPKVKSYPSLSAKENASDQWPLKLIETVIKRHLPNTNVRIMKLDPATATRMALSTL